MPGFVDDAARVAFRDAVAAVERASQAEIVVSVRRQSAPWTLAHVAVGVAVAIAMHAYMLFGSHPFSTPGLFFGPIVTGLLGGLASTQVLGVPRWIIPRGRQRAAVRHAAEATFVERGMRRTRGATGILIYVSVVERMAEVIADDGVVAAVDATDWAPLCRAIDGAVARGGTAVAAMVAALGPVLSEALPARDDDVNELPDELHGDAS